jgi:hypothetical protein
MRRASVSERKKGQLRQSRVACQSRVGPTQRIDLKLPDRDKAPVQALKRPFLALK